MIFKKKKQYEEGSLKDKVARYTSILWILIFVSFGIVMIMSMADEFFINRAVWGKYLTRTALFSLVVIFIVDGVVGLVRDSDKVKT
ncbi:MAG: hypothetical protein JXR48_04930 [Candidatus Delongbacteria bacterium]|nr:hypothetical protein [Candidatus Delongbacteria bacterium]MBN2834292.1 hypothetical protein [Candidatus Delongbacteria bacterium]